MLSPMAGMGTPREARRDTQPYIVAVNSADVDARLPLQAGAPTASTTAYQSDREFLPQD